MFIIRNIELIRDTEEHPEDLQLIALNLAFEAAAMGEPGRMAFEFACESLEYSDSVEKKLSNTKSNKSPMNSDPVSPFSVVCNSGKPDLKQRSDEQIDFVKQQVRLNRLEVENLLNSGNKK